ncbi:MAG: DNA helicase [Pirellulaceae bacterium]|nr:MAG: DNA helicase [Pirellulaceae bacterium]
MTNGLNPEQLDAVQTLRGPLLVLAGAGSGKTRVVTYRIANLIRHGTPAERILAVTFTNKAAKEMRERILGLLGGKRATRGKEKRPRPVIGTFHAHCVQILRRHAQVLGYPARFAIYDRSDQEAVAREVLRALRVHSGMLKPADLLYFISQWKNAGVRPEQAAVEARTDKEHVAASGFRRYQEAVRLAGAMDFDDLLLLTEALFSQHPAIRQEEAGRFDHILVDEYQDTNQTQYAIIRMLAEDHRNLCVVGDDDQSIYGWRGAEVRHILNFQRDWPDAKVVRLEANYRSTAAIIEYANRLIAFNKVRHDKILRPARHGGRPPRVLQFKTEAEEAQKIAQEIARIIDRGERQPRDIAILFRTNEQPRVFETELRKVRVPYSLVGTQSFFDRKEVRDLLSYLKLIDQPQDEVSLLRVINFPPRGIGVKSVETLLKRAVAAGKPVWDMMEDRGLIGELPKPSQTGIHHLRNLVIEYQQMFAQGTEPMVDVVRRLINRLELFAVLERAYPTPEEVEARKGTIIELVNAIGEYETSTESPTLAGFLDEVMLAGREFGSKSKDRGGNSVTLMTYHSAKGLEFPVVYMVGMEEGILPHRRTLQENYDDVEEERRLCYVGVTRAQDELTLSFPLQRMKWGKLRPTFVSRFLYEMTGQADNPNRLRAMRAARQEILGATPYRSAKKTSSPGGQSQATSRRQAARRRHGAR